MSSFNSLEFKHFIQQKIEGGGKKQLYSKFRSLSKYHNSQFEEVIKCAVVKYEKLKGLATSNFAPQIQNLKLSVPVESIYLDDLCYISTKYFVNIQYIKLRFENSKEYKYVFDRHLLQLKEDLTIRCLSIAKNQYVQALSIFGSSKYSLRIFNSKFDGLQVQAQANPRVEISGVKFINSPNIGIWANICTSVKMKDIFAKNCTKGLFIFSCQNFVASNINVKQCKKCGFGIRFVKNFQIANVKIFNCGQGQEYEQGLCLHTSKGKITDVVVEECNRQGVHIIDAQVRYQRVQYINNSAGNDVMLRGQFTDFVEEV